MSIDRYAVQEFDHVYVNGVETAVEFDHDAHVIRASRAAALAEVVAQVARVATKRERRRGRRLIDRVPIPVVGKVSGVLWVLSACVA
jgi:hypothetical protein